MKRIYYLLLFFLISINFSYSSNKKNVYEFKIKEKTLKINSDLIIDFNKDLSDIIKILGSDYELELIPVFDIYCYYLYNIWLYSDNNKINQILFMFLNEYNNGKNLDELKISGMEFKRNFSFLNMENYLKSKKINFKIYNDEKNKRFNFNYSNINFLIYYRNNNLKNIENILVSF